jgi:PBP1b-binding outer membrane lipoprotein LpoB
MMRAGSVALVTLLALALAGCADAPVPTPTPTSTPTQTAAPVDETPQFDPYDNATANKVYFDMVNNDLIAAGGALDGRAFIDNLVAAGFSKTDMEVTNDRTAINGAADNIQFSVRLNGTCLIGQYGNVGYDSTATTLLTTGKCLVGETRTIDW